MRQDENMTGETAASTAAPGAAELRRALAAAGRRAIPAALVFSAAVNLLMLTGPLFMLQVYDRVLTSRAAETLAALLALAVFLHLVAVLLDGCRGRIMARVGAAFLVAMEPRVFAAVLARRRLHPADLPAQAAQPDLEAVQRALAAPVLAALFDLPFVPFFLGLIVLLHPLLGGVAALGAAALALAEALGAEAELAAALGMQGAGLARWRALRRAALAAALQAAEAGGSHAAVSRGLRLLLQTALLAAGAWLVLRGEMAPGAMIASSILTGRALAPVEQVVAGWPQLQRAQAGWARLARFLAATPPPALPLPLPRPRALLEVTGLTVAPPGSAQPALRMVSFRLEPGQALGVIGPSGAGKSTLARALTAAWAPLAGSIRLDGATLDRYPPEALGALTGYLPQRVTLFEGTVAENIARLAPAPDPAAVVAAARRAGAHEMILHLPQGYDTPLGPGGAPLSGGQMQRIGLARALYGAPVLLVLDEPNSSLDHDGSEALNGAIRSVKAAGGAVLIMAHRPAAIRDCDQLLLLDAGTRRAYGPRDDVLRTTLVNHADLGLPGHGPARLGGVA